MRRAAPCRRPKLFIGKSRSEETDFVAVHQRASLGQSGSGQLILTFCQGREWAAARLFSRQSHSVSDSVAGGASVANDQRHTIL